MRPVLFLFVGCVLLFLYGCWWREEASDVDVARGKRRATSVQTVAPRRTAPRRPTPRITTGPEGQELSIRIQFWPPSGKVRLGAVRYTYYLSDDGKELKHGVEELWTSEKPAPSPRMVIAHGRKVKEQTFERGKLRGNIKYWLSEGKVEGKIPLREGRPHGQSRAVYSNGNTAEEGKYSNGKRVGVWTFYKEDGTIRERKDYGSAE